MVDEVETYCVLLYEENRSNEIEDTYLWLMNHKEIPKETRIKYGVRIFDIADGYYKPKIRAEELLVELLKIDPESKNLDSLALRILETLDNSNTKKTFYSALSSDNKQHLSDYLNYCSQVI